MKRTKTTLPRKTLGKPYFTQRGFGKLEFIDHYGIPCSLQQSSLSVEGGAIWLGTDDPQPKIRIKDAKRQGLNLPIPAEDQGFEERWIPCPLPEDILLSTRMHLSADQVKALVGHLQNWLKTGKF